MCVLKKMRTALATLVLVPAWALADEAASPVAVDSPPVQAAPAMIPAMAPPMPPWPPVMAMQGASPYFVAPQPGMMWPMQWQYPVPMMMPPFVWVMVPVPAMASLPVAVPAVIDYGPVADTPVVVMPVPDEAEEADEASARGREEPLNASRGEDKPASDAAKSPIAPAETAGSPQPDVAESPAGAAAKLNAVSAGMVADDGSVASKPVTALPAPPSQQQEVAARPRSQTRTVSKPLRKPAAAKRPKQPAPVAAKPVKKRLCWVKGVVEPCR